MTIQNNDRPQGYWRVPDLLIEVSAETVSALEIFYSNLIKFNAQLNLIVRKTELDADILHIVDTVRACEIVLKDSKSPVIFDLFSGNGLPGVVLSLLDPARSIVVVEPDEARANFVRFVAETLKLKKVLVIQKNLASLAEGEVPCGVTRSASRLTKNILGARAAVRKGGDYYHLRGSGWVSEIAEIPSQICTLWTPRLVQEYELPIVVTRMAVVCTKRT